ncbi:MAG: ferredoxin [Gemmatimonadales bacterium]|nr:ferredoxin [Gemmatimonadales bacterium]
MADPQPRTRPAAAADFEERQVGELRIRIDRTLCVGFGDCIEAAGQAFVLDDEGIVTFLEPEKVERERLLSACDVCPVDALTVWDLSRNQLVPR